MSTPEREKLKRALHPLTEEHGATAAVALLLKEDRDGHILFVKRAVSPEDPWSGQIALSGGKKDSTDRDLIFSTAGGSYTCHRDVLFQCITKTACFSSIFHYILK